MVQANLKIIEDLKGGLELIASEKEFRSLFTSRDSDFIRTRKLPLSHVAGFILNLPKRSLSIELKDFFDHLNGGLSCTKGAFSFSGLN